MGKNEYLKDTINYGKEDEKLAFERYAEDLFLDESALDGKKILDVGSNIPLFRGYLEGKYPETKVVSIDQEFNTSLDVQSLAEHLPFQDNSFDLAVAHSSLTGLGNGEKIEQIFQELIRVLCPNGEIRIGPIMIDDDADLGEKQRRAIKKNKNFVNELKNSRVISSVEYLRIPRTIGKKNIQVYCLVIKK